MTVSRRRFLRIASAACLLPHAAEAFHWQGTAMGAPAQIILDHPNSEDITRRAIAEIDRLEDIFSLYRANSEIVRLNAKGRVDLPSFEMLECLSIARRVHTVTQGCFDPTVQPVWQVLTEAIEAGLDATTEQLRLAHAMIGFQSVRYDPAAVILSDGQKITLNGIAQGYIADKVADLMQSLGVEDVLIDTGEIVAMGHQKSQVGWPVTISGASSLRLTQRALATSAPFGTVLDKSARIGHIFDPRTYEVVTSNIAQVSVSAWRASFADALSTGLSLMADESEMRLALSEIKDARLENVQVRTDTL